MATAPTFLLDLAQTEGSDPAKAWVGAPPYFGQEVLPHINTMAGAFGLISRSYLNPDEAMRHNVANAERMRQDCHIMECMEARQRATALLNWHIEPEDAKSQEQKVLAEQMTNIIKRTPRFIEMRRNLLEAIWYGRYATAATYKSVWVGSHARTVVDYWEPRHGDKLVFRFSTGDGKTKRGQVGIKQGLPSMYSKSVLSPDDRKHIQPTEQGMVYWLDDDQRKTIVVHKHMIEDGPYDDSRTAGRIHGVGVRSKIYWTWYMMVEVLQRVLEYLDRSALGVEIWRYPANNPQAKTAAQEAAFNHIGGGRSIVLCPVFPGEQSELFGVEHLEPGMGGVDAMMEVIKTYFGHRIKRYILGQTLSSEADATGMGSGVADAHLATLADIVAYDARNLEETLTTDFLRPLQLWNFPHAKHVDLRFVIDTESPNVQEKMAAYKAAWDMGAEIKASDVCDVIGAAMPGPKDKRLYNPQVKQLTLQMDEQIEKADEAGLDESLPHAFYEQQYK